MVDISFSIGKGSYIFLEIKHEIHSAAQIKIHGMRHLYKYIYVYIYIYIYIYIRALIALIFKKKNSNTFSEIRTRVPQIVRAAAIPLDH